MKNDNESYFSDEYFNNYLKCNRPKSFSNFINPYRKCSDDYTNAIRKKLSDSSEQYKSNFVNAGLALLKAFDNYMLKECVSISNKDKLIECVLEGSNANIIKPFVRNVVLRKDSQGYENVKVFNNESCSSQSPKLTFYQIQGTVDSIEYKK